MRDINCLGIAVLRFSSTPDYRTHPKDGGRYCFQFTPRRGGGYPIWLTQWTGGYPIPDLDREISCPRSRWGVPHPRLGWEVPHLADGGAYPHLRSGLGGVCHPRSGWLGVPHPADGGTPSKIRMGVTPPRQQDWVAPPPHQGLNGDPLPPSGDRSPKRALATRRAVCLLRSRRSTFLC